MQGKEGQAREQSRFIIGSWELIPTYTKDPTEDGFTLVTNMQAKGKVWLKTH